jgi:O-antigen/teichoic acid export membrane protein
VFVLPLLSLQDYVEGVARSFKWTGLAIAPPYILRQGGIAASMIACVVIGAPAEAWVAVACTLAAALMTLLIQISLLVYRIRGTLPAAPRAYRVREWAIASLPLAMYDLTLTGFNFVDVLLMGFFLPPEEVAIYFAATRILQFAVFASYSASAATAARFAETKASGDHASLRALVVRTARLTSGATVLIGAAVFLTAPLLLRMFGPGFEASLSPLSVLLVGIVVYSLFGPAEDVLNMLGGERLCAVMALAALSVAVILNVVLIPRYGIMGAAFAMATANIVRGAGLSFVARTRLGIPTHVLARSE